MTDTHNQVFFGQNTALIVSSSSSSDPFMFIHFFKKKPNGTWEKPSFSEGKAIKLSLEEIVNAIQKVWIVANYFYFIDIKKESVDQYHIIFKHHQNKRYSNYWFGYFKELFDSEDLSFKCVVEGEEFDETLSMTVKKLHDKVS